MQSPIDHVHHLNSTTFRPFIESMSIVLLSVVMLPISKRSRILVPEFQKVADIMQGSGVEFAQINALDNSEALLPFEISSYPQVMLFRGLDDFRSYREPFKEPHFIAYLNRLLRLPVLSEVSETSLPEFKEKSDAVVVGFISEEDQESQKRFQSLASAMYPEYAFGIASSPVLAKQEDVEVPGVMVYRALDKEKHTVPMLQDQEKMMDMVRKNARPLIIDMAFETHDSFLDMGFPLAYIFARSTEERSRLRKAFEPLAREYRRGIQFAIADPVDLGEIMDDLHLDGNHLPALAIREPVNNLRYPMDNTANDSLIMVVEDFVQEFLHGNLQPTIMSEPLPPKDSPDALIKVVGLNYQEVVMDTTKDVLLVFCIVPCGPCDAFQPTLTALAELYASNPHLKRQVRVGKVRYDVNDTPERNIRAFPTIKLFPAASKAQPEIFLGPRNLDALADFIRDKGTYGADLRGKSEQAMEGGARRAVEDVCAYKDVVCDAKTSMPTEESGRSAMSDTALTTGGVAESWFHDEL